jgi:hypothetical protein
MAAIDCLTTSPKKGTAQAESPRRTHVDGTGRLQTVFPLPVNHTPAEECTVGGRHRTVLL